MHEKTQPFPSGRLPPGMPASFLHIILTVPIVTRGNLRHNRKTVPVSCETGKNMCHGQNEEKAGRFGEKNYSEPGRWTSRKKVL